MRNLVLRLKNFSFQLAIRQNKTEEQVKHEKNHAECQSLATSKLHALDCCVYPRFCDAFPPLLQLCADECRSLPYPDFRCQRQCIIVRNGWLLNLNQTNSSAIVKSFFEGSEVEDDELKVLSPSWLSVVEKSASTCEVELAHSNKTLKEIPSKVEDGIATVFTFHYYNNFVECVRKMNFVNCPEKHMKKSSECEKFTQTLIKCNTTDYALTHKLFFEDFYYHAKRNAQ